MHHPPYGGLSHPVWSGPRGAALCAGAAAATPADGKGGGSTDKGVADHGGDGEGWVEASKGKSQGSLQGKRREKGPKGILVEILRTAPRHDALEVPCMEMMTLRKEIKKRLAGRPWDKVRRDSDGSWVGFMPYGA